MSAGPELSIMYHNQQYYNTPSIISQHQEYRIHQQQQQQQQQQQEPYMNKLPLQQYNSKGLQQHHGQMMSQVSEYDGGSGQHNNNSRQQSHFRVVSPPLSVASSSTTTSTITSSTSSYYNSTTINNNNKNAKLLLPVQPPPKFSSTSNIATSSQQTGQGQQGRQSTWNFTWLVFMNEKWVPFDIINQTKLEQTLTVGGTFVDITDSHFPDVKRVRVFPRNNYLSYLGVKYRLSRIMQPDAYLDHVAVAEAKQPSTSLSPPPASSNNIIISIEDNSTNNRNRRAWEI